MTTLDTDREQRLRELAELDRERRYWEANYAALQAQYAEQFVAIKPVDETFIAADSDFEALLVELDRRGIEPTTVWYTWIRAADKLYIL